MYVPWSFLLQLNIFMYILKKMQTIIGQKFRCVFVV